METECRASSEQIIAAVGHYASRVCRQLQHADRQDVRHDAITYMLSGDWTQASYRRAIWLQLVNLTTRVKRRGRVYAVIEEKPAAPPADIRLMVEEVYRVAARDAVDRRILQLLAAGNTWQATASKLRLSLSKISRRLATMRDRLMEAGWVGSPGRSKQCGLGEGAQKVLGGG